MKGSPKVCPFDKNCCNTLLRLNEDIMCYLLDSDMCSTV